MQRLRTKSLGAHGWALLLALAGVSGCDLEPSRIASGPVERPAGVLEAGSSDTRWGADDDLAMDGDTGDTRVDVGFDADLGEVSCAAPGCGWRQRLRITFHNLERGALTGLPVAVRLDAASFDYGATRPDGLDLRFVDQDGLTVLPHEVEAWDPAGTSWLWVRVPDIAAASDDDFVWLYFDGPADALGTAPPAAAVWDSDYVGVYHLKGRTEDSTAHGNHGASQGEVYVPGMAGLAYQFDTTPPTAIVVPASASLDTIDTQLTIGFWLLRKDDGLGWQQVVSRQLGTDWRELFGFGYLDSVASAMVETDTGRTSEAFGAVTLGTWTYYALTWDGASLRGYADGAEVGSGARDGTLADSTNPMLIGGNVNHSTISEVPGGFVDEVRISRVARSADWVSSHHAMLSGTFTTLGPAETL